MLKKKISFSIGVLQEKLIKRHGIGTLDLGLRGLASSTDEDNIFLFWAHRASLHSGRDGCLRTVKKI